MFYIILSVVIVVLLGAFCLFKFVVLKNDERFNKVINKVLKICVIIYCALMLANILLPDGFGIEKSAEYLGGGRLQGYAMVRWLSMVAFVALPIAVFYKNRTMRNIAIYFCTVMTIVSICFYPQYLESFTSLEGRGVNSLSIASQGFKSFMINGTFRSIWFGLLLTLQFIIPIILAIQEEHMFDFKNKYEYINFFTILPFVIMSIVPIYVPQYLFGITNYIFDAFNLAHILWFVFTIAELIVLYFIFRKKDYEVKMVLLLVLALSLVMQYNQMFGVISLNIARLPFQLCNLGAYLILFSLITKNKKLFNFTVIINVVGAIIALATPALDGEGLFYVYNMHFIFEHTNVLIIPILALMFGIFPRLDKQALKDCLVGFALYFVAIWVLGTTFNAIALSSGNSFWEANYMFMFNKETAIDVLPFTGALFDINFKIGYGVFYPVLQLIIFVFFVAMCVLLYFLIRLIYKINDKIKEKGNQHEKNLVNKK